MKKSDLQKFLLKKCDFEKIVRKNRKQLRKSYEKRTIGKIS